MSRSNVWYGANCVMSHCFSYSGKGHIIGRWGVMYARLRSHSLMRLLRQLSHCLSDLGWCHFAWASSADVTLFMSDLGRGHIAWWVIICMRKDDSKFQCLGYDCMAYKDYMELAVWERPLTHWGRVMHISVSKLTIIGSDNGLTPTRHQAIIWTNVGIMLIRTLGTNSS